MRSQLDRVRGNDSNVGFSLPRERRRDASVGEAAPVPRSCMFTNHSMTLLASKPKNLKRPVIGQNTTSAADIVTD